MQAPKTYSFSILITVGRVTWKHSNCAVTCPVKKRLVLKVLCKKSKFRTCLYFGQNPHILRRNLHSSLPRRYKAMHIFSRRSTQRTLTRSRVFDMTSQVTKNQHQIMIDIADPGPIYTDNKQFQKIIVQGRASDRAISLVRFGVPTPKKVKISINTFFFSSSENTCQ